MSSAHPPQTASMPHGDVDPVAAETFLARQPIFNTGRQLIGYELLYSPAPWETFDDPETPRPDPTTMTRRTLHSALDGVGLDALLGGHRAFVNISPANLLEEDHLLLPSEQTVLELAAGDAISESVRTACASARRAGYQIALDGYEPGCPASALLPAVDLIKIDFRAASQVDLPAQMRPLQQKGLLLAAKHVETQADFDRAISLGFQQVQGYFFCHPELLSTPRPTVGESVRLRFLAELSRPQMNLDQIEAILKTDLALSRSLLQYLNSAFLGIRHRIESVRQALVMLGERPLRRWGSLTALSMLAHRKPHQLLLTSLVRARFCENLACLPTYGSRKMDLFLVGLFSLLDAILDQPMDVAIAPLPLSDEVRQALLGDQEQPLGRALALALASERGAWNSVSALCLKLQLTQREVAGFYYETLRWSHQQLDAA